MSRIYKESSPLATVTKIRNILNDLNLFTYECFWANPYPEVYSMRVECAPSEGGFGTNGKGRSYQFCLASGYAEFIERLQNGFVVGVLGLNRMLLNELKKEHGFFYYPDEKTMTEAEFRKLPEEFLNDLFPTVHAEERNSQITNYFSRLKENGQEGVISVPFYCPNSGELVYLPYNLTLSLTGTNGMAAGNTAAEGIFQGICELMERYAVTTVYYTLLTPPTVPDDYLQKFPEEYKIIQEIESKGYVVEIKDFSAGMGLPAVGIIIYNSDKTKYRLNVGSETSFKFALSRAITEVYQGSEDKETFDSQLLDTPVVEHSYFFEDTEDAIKQRRKEINQFTINGQGVFPKALFGDTPSYCFNPAVFTPQDTYEQEVRKLIKLFADMGKNVYIRDVSFLGFPSYYIFIPGVSVLGCKSIGRDAFSLNITDSIVKDKVEDYFFGIENHLGDKDKIRLLTKILSVKISNFTGDKITAKYSEEEGGFGMMYDVLKLDFNNDAEWKYLPVSFFTTLFNTILEDYERAIRDLKAFMEETGNEEDDYYKEVLKFLQLRLAEAPEDAYKSISQEVVDDFASPELFLKNIDLPSCPNCGECKLAQGCKTRSSVEITHSVARNMNKKLRQIDLHKVFSIN